MGTLVAVRIAEALHAGQVVLLPAGELHELAQLRRRGDKLSLGGRGNPRLRLVEGGNGSFLWRPCSRHIVLATAHLHLTHAPLVSLLRGRKAVPFIFTIVEADKNRRDDRMVGGGAVCQLEKGAAPPQTPHPRSECSRM